MNLFQQWFGPRLRTPLNASTPGLRAHREGLSISQEYSKVIQTEAHLSRKADAPIVRAANGNRIPAPAGNLWSRANYQHFAVSVGAALFLGELREEDFHLSSGHFGFRSDGPRRRALGYPGSGQTIAGTNDQAYRRSRKA